MLCRTVCITFAVLASVTIVNSDYGVFGFLDGEFDMRICPGYAKPDFCDKKRDLLWIMKARGKVWGHKCRNNLQGVEETICGAVLRGTENKYKLCKTLNATRHDPLCRRACRHLFNSLSGACTIGNKKHERCICYIHKIKTDAT